MKPAARRKARRLALQAVYQWQMTSDPIGSIELQYITDNSATEYDVDYFRDLLSGIASSVGELDKQIAPLVSRPLDDVDHIEKAILRIAAFELSRRQDVPYRVVINEAIELAKSFASDDSHKFVNGVLDKLAKQASQAQKKAPDDDA